MNDILEKLQQTILERKNADGETSYVASLLNADIEKVGRKVTEEASEVLVSALKETDDRIVSESADLLFHLMVLLAHKNIDVQDVLKELESRMGISGLDEKAARIAKDKGKL